MNAVTETVYSDTHETACDGGGGPLGHPRVYLYIPEKQGEIECPYCSRRFLYRASGKKASH